MRRIRLLSSLLLALAALSAGGWEAAGATAESAAVTHPGAWAGRPTAGPAPDAPARRGGTWAASTPALKARVASAEPFFLESNAEATEVGGDASGRTSGSTGLRFARSAAVGAPERHDDVRARAVTAGWLGYGPSQATVRAGRLSAPATAPPSPSL